MTRKHNPAIRGCFAAAVMLAGLVGSAVLADFESGLRAYKRGDYERALCEWQQLASLGHLEAVYRLGILHAEGDAARRDWDAAASWFRRAAERGHLDAAMELGEMYYSGRGVPRDLVEAYMWLRLAADFGLQEARRSLLRVSRQLTDEQFDEARRRVEEFRPTSSDNSVVLLSILDAQAPELLSFVKPVFPKRAEKQRAEGRIVLAAVILEDGTVGTIDIEECSTSYRDPKPDPSFPICDESWGFGDAATEAVEKWFFIPPARDGEPAETVVRITALFGQYTHGSALGKPAIRAQGRLMPDRAAPPLSARLHVTYLGPQPSILNKEITVKLSSRLKRRGYRIAPQERARYSVYYGFGTKKWHFDQYTHFFSITLVDNQAQSASGEPPIVWTGDARFDTLIRDPCSPIEFLDRLMDNVSEVFGETRATADTGIFK